MNKFAFLESKLPYPINSLKDQKKVEIDLTNCGIEDGDVKQLAQELGALVLYLEEMKYLNVYMKNNSKLTELGTFEFNHYFGTLTDIPYLRPLAVAFDLEDIKSQQINRTD